MIMKIYEEDYIPSTVLKFQITDLFVEKNEKNSFVALRSEAVNASEKEGINKLFNMMLSLRQQKILRSKSEIGRIPEDKFDKK